MAETTYTADRYSMAVRCVTAMLRHNIIDELTVWLDGEGTHHLTATHLPDARSGTKRELSAAEVLAVHENDALCRTCPSPGARLGSRLAEDVMELLWLDLVHDAFANRDDAERHIAMTLAALWSVPSRAGGSIRTAIESVLPTLIEAHQEHRSQAATAGTPADLAATAAQEQLGEAGAASWDTWSWVSVADPLWSLAVRGRAWFATVWPLYLAQDAPPVSTLGETLPGESRLLVAVPGDAAASTLRRHVLGVEFHVGTHGRYTARNVTDALRLTADGGTKNADLSQWLKALEAASS